MAKQRELKTRADGVKQHYNTGSSVTSNVDARAAFNPRPAKKEPSMNEESLNALNRELASAVNVEGVTARVELRDSGPVLVLDGEHVEYVDDIDSDPLYGQFIAEIANEYRAKGVRTIPAGALSDGFDEYNSQLGEFNSEGEDARFDVDEFTRGLVPMLEKNGLSDLPVENTVTSRFGGWYRGEITEERFTELAQEELDDRWVNED